MNKNIKEVSKVKKGLILLITILSFLLITTSFGQKTVTIRYGVWMSEQIDGIKAQISAFEKNILILK